MESENNETVSILPSKWKTQILEKEIMEGEDNFPNVQIRVLVDIKSQDEFAEWLTDFETKTKSSYVISNTDVKGGKLLVFKRRLKCHHNTGCKRLYDPSVKGKTRNTNCPARMTVKIHKIQKNYRGIYKEKHDLLKVMPCEIILVLTHNHSTTTSDILKFRKVTHTVKEQLMELFCIGHSPRTALEIIKINIQLYSEDPSSALADRSQCPDYDYCYYIYTKEFKQKFEHLINETNDVGFLERKIAEYNKNQGAECAKIVFGEDQNNDYVIGITTPIMKRINTYDIACQTIIIDSSGKLDKDKRRVFLFLADSAIGLLPLGVIIAIEKVESLTIGLNIIKELLGKSMFGGHPEGPRIFFTDESSAEQNAIGNVWPKTKCLLSTFHVLRSVFKWLAKYQNYIPKSRIPALFRDFQNILYAKTIGEMCKKFRVAKQNAKHYENYVNYITDYWWERNVLWALAYRDNWLLNNNSTNNLESNIRELKNDIIGRLRPFTIVQAMDFIMTKYEEYLKKKLLVAANNCLRNILCQRVELFPNEFANSIKKINDNMVAVPSEVRDHLLNIVNMDLVICSCLDGSKGYICKHIDWANTLYYSKSYSSKIDNVKLRQTYFFIATGKKGLVVGLVPLANKNETKVENSLNETMTSVNSEVKTTKMDSSLNEEDFIKQFNVTFFKISQIFHENLMKSPQEMAKSAEKMLENMKKIKNTSDFASAMDTFGFEKS